MKEAKCGVLAMPLSISKLDFVLFTLIQLSVLILCLFVWTKCQNNGLIKCENNVQKRIRVYSAKTKFQRRGNQCTCQRRRL